jgi:anti-sigma factor (TIGR02949 family)
MSSEKEINCEEALRHLFEYLDKALEGDLQHQMEQHMSNCRSCFSRLEFEQSLKAHVHRAGSDSAPASLRAKISNLVAAFDKNDS